MAFPQVAATNGGANDTASQSHTVNLPAGIQAGDLLIVLFAIRSTATITFPSGWTKLFDDAYSSYCQMVAAYRVADGSEGGTISVTTSANKYSTHISYRVTGYDAVPVVGTPVHGYGSSPNPPYLEPWWSAMDTLWLAMCCVAYNSTISGFPTNYTNGITYKNNTTSGCAIGSAQREYHSISENPGTFYIGSTARYSIANTLAIKPPGPCEWYDVEVLTTYDYEAAGQPVAALTGEDGLGLAAENKVAGYPNVAVSGADGLVAADHFSPLLAEIVSHDEALIGELALPLGSILAGLDHVTLHDRLKIFSPGVVIPTIYIVVRHPALLKVVQRRLGEVWNTYSDLSSLDEQQLTRELKIPCQKGDTLEVTTLPGLVFTYRV